jgi:citrate synthase
LAISRTTLGYPIEQIAEKSNFLEVCYLTLFGELPNESQWETFRSDIHSHTMVHEGLRTMLTGYRRGAHPMSMMLGLVGGLSSFYHEGLDVNNPEHRMLTCYRLVAKMPTIAADVLKYGLLCTPTILMGSLKTS